MPRVGQVKTPFWPWDRQPKETSKNYQAFLFFRDMAPHERSLMDAYRRYSNQPEATVQHHGNFKVWYKDFHWLERAKAWDQHVEAQREKAIIKEKQQLARKHVRQIEISARAALEENAALAHSNIADLMSWDEDGKVKLKPSDELAPHVTAAISKVSMVHDRMGNPNITVEMHPKVRPLDLEGQHFELWESDKKQTERAAANNFLDLLTAIKSGKLDKLVEELRPSVAHPPPGITVTRNVPTTLSEEELKKGEDEY